VSREPAGAAAPTPRVCVHAWRGCLLSGVDMLVDVHGDEELPAVFLAGAEGISGWSERLQLLQVAGCCGSQTQTAQHVRLWVATGNLHVPPETLHTLGDRARTATRTLKPTTTQGAFSTAFRRASPDFQTALGYAVDAPNQANMSICSNQVRCLCTHVCARTWLWGAGRAHGSASRGARLVPAARVFVPSGVAACAGARRTCCRLNMLPVCTCEPCADCPEV
jgi:hypothetical protein